LYGQTNGSGSPDPLNKRQSPNRHILQSGSECIDNSFKRWSYKVNFHYAEGKGRCSCCIVPMSKYRKMIYPQGLHDITDQTGDGIQN